MANFSKGPWKATRIAPFSYQITTDHPHGHAHFGIIVQEVRSEENARLIATAPELYEAADRVLSTLADFLLESDRRAISSESSELADVRRAGDELARIMRKAVGRG